MKKNTLHVVLALLASLFFVATVNATTIGKISFVSGNAQIQNGSEAWKNINIGTTVLDTSRIQTGYNGKVTVTMINGTRMAIGKATLIGMEKFATGEYGTQTNVNLRIGTITAYVAKEDKSRNYFRVRTPTAVAGVRGTVEQISYLPDSGTEVTLIESAADVINRQGIAAKVPQGSAARSHAKEGMQRPLDKAKMDARVRMENPGMDREERKGAAHLKGVVGNPGQWKAMQKDMRRLRHIDRFDARKGRIMELERL